MSFIIAKKQDCHEFDTLEEATNAQIQLSSLGCKILIGEVTEPYKPIKMAVEGKMQNF